ncbi:C2 and C2B_Munc13-like domain-containing protein staccato isoform X2 [Lycorma delicatula]|uniref:C2 and C2B_Munc13-like domain-containing protein staccato isoform X2 n=1 Tax=Lycorma delicatula TaxID=130591 RepID=UPI003F5155FD
MDEDAMWKNFYERIQRQESKEKTEHDIKVHELDGGFFEKFGTLLKEEGAEDQNEITEEDINEEPAVVETPEEPVTPEEEEEEEVGDKGEIISNAVGCNNVAKILIDASRNKEKWKRNLVKLYTIKNFREFATNAVEELYSEVLYEILHIVGSDANLSEEDNDLFSYLQEAFKIDQERHDSILETVKTKEAPKIFLNVEVVEAKELRPMDANGLSDPFCTLFLSSTPTRRCNTSMKEQTLHPVWEEHFSLPVENVPEDVLCVEVWDFDPAETVREKMTKIKDVKGIKGFRKLMKEIAVAASTGKHDNEFIGSTLVPLKTVPASGQTFWCNLEKQSKVKSQGMLKIKVAFSAEKNSHVAGQEHRHLLRILLLHELEINKVKPYQWNGKFSGPAETILRQHLAQSGLNVTDNALAQWVEFSSIHVNHPLSFQLFSNLVKILIHPINNGLFSDEEIKLFWDAAKKLLPSCFNNIKRIRNLPPGEASSTLQVQSLLTILSELSKVQQTENLDLFPSSVYGWIKNSEDSPNSDIRAALHDAVTQSAVDWYLHIIEHKNLVDNSDDAVLKHHTEIISKIMIDLKKAIEYYDKLFSQIMLFPYSKTLYMVYENKISELCEPVVTDVCACFKPIRFNDDKEMLNTDDSEFAIGKTLFTLYLDLQRFSILGTGLCPGDMEGLRIKKFHFWFHRGVAQWFDIAVCAAMRCVNKAVELDKLTPEENSSNDKISSSPIDTLTIFYQIRLFWKQLAWPDVEGCYTFVAKIMDDICRCSVFYADMMSKKVDNLGHTETVYEKKFEVTNEWCLAINNIDYVRKHIRPFAKELGIEDIIKALADFRSPTEAERCKETLELVIDNAVETVQSKILDLLEVVTVKMKPSISRFLLEGAELLNQESNRVDRLMQYLEDNLVTLSSQLNADNFDRILNILYEKLAYIMYDLVESNLERRRPPSFFANLHVMLKTLVGYFKQGDESSTLNSNNNNELLSKIEKVLSLHGMETWQLIHQCHLERLNEQQAMTTATFGVLTVRMQFVHDLLRIEIMNGRNILPMDDDGSCDPYVKIHLVPEDRFSSITKPRTKTHKKNLFPLFEETFSIQLTREQREIKDAMVHFLVKDQDFLGMSSDFVAEAYFPFSGIPSTTMETRLEEMSQIHLKLSKPSRFDSAAIKALEHRQGEKLAKDFIKKQKAKTNIKIITNGATH